MPDRLACHGAALVAGGALLFCLTAVAVPAQARGALDARSAATWATLLAAQDARSADTMAVDAALASSFAPLRAAGARTIGGNRIAARYAALRTLLRTDRDTAVARDAAFALGLAADTAACAPLTTALGSTHAGAAAAWALGELAGQCGPFAPMLAMARAPAVRAALLRVAVKWSPFPDSAVTGAWRTARTHDERWSALYALARARRSAGGALALAAARDTSAALRELAARLLAQSTQAAPGDSAQRRLRLLLRDRQPHVRISAVRSLASYGVVAVASFDSAWTGERDANVRVTMAQSLGGIAPPDAAAWGRWWRSDTTHMVRRSLLASAWQAGAIGAVEGAAGTPLVSDPDHRIRIAMIQGASARGADRTASMLAALAADPDARVRAAAVEALASVSPPVRDSVGWARIESAAALDADAGVRQALTDPRIRNARASDVPFALSMYARAEADSGSDARESALGIVASAWRRDSAQFSDASIAALRALTPSRDAIVRQRARGVGPLQHWAGAAPAVPAVVDYSRIVRDVVMPSLAGRAPLLVLDTDRGTIRIHLDGVHAPMTADHLSALARRGYFTGLRFHRVVPAFVAQGGDPRGDGSGGPGFAIRDELNRSPYRRASVGMALSGPDTGGSQFFLTLAPQPHLEGHYTVFGQVVAGLASMDALVQGDALRTMTPLPR